jgi:hypothetical protein
MCLKDHVLLISDFSLRLESTIKHYKWYLDKINLSPEEHSISSQWLEVLGTENVSRSMLNSICPDIVIKQRSST